MNTPAQPRWDYLQRAANFSVRGHLVLKLTDVVSANEKPVSLS